MSVILPSAPKEGKPKKLLEQVRDVMRFKHYSIRTERCYGDWRVKLAHGPRIEPGLKF